MTAVLTNLLGTLFYKAGNPSKPTTKITTRTYLDPEDPIGIIKHAEEYGLSWKITGPNGSLSSDSCSDNLRQWSSLLESIVRDLLLPAAAEEESSQKVVVYQDDHFLINGQRVNIPDVVLNRLPLLDENEEPNYMTFPDFKDGRKMSCVVSHDDNAFVIYDGQPMSRTSKLDGMTRKAIIATLEECSRQANLNPMVMTTEASFDEGSFILSRCDEWACFSIVINDGILIQVYQRIDNPDSYQHDKECIIASYAFVRAALLAYAANKHSVTSINENDFAQILLALFVADRY